MPARIETFYIIDRGSIPEEFEDVLLNQMEGYRNGCYVRLHLYREDNEYSKKYDQNLIPITEWVKKENPGVDVNKVLVDWSW